MPDLGKMSCLTSVTPQPDDLVESKRTCVSECVRIVNKQRRSRPRGVGYWRLRRYDVYVERRPHPLQSRRRFMVGWCGGRTVFQVYLVEEVSSFVEEPHLVLLHG